MDVKLAEQQFLVRGGWKAWQKFIAKMTHTIINPKGFVAWLQLRLIMY